MKLWVMGLLTALLLTIGCSRQDMAKGFSYSMTSEAAPMLARAAAAPVEMNDSDDIPEGADLTAAERKLVKRANIRIRVENLEAADASIISLMEKYNAYSASTSIEENYYTYSLRVPSHYYEIFLSEMNGMGRMLHRNESTEDVTLRYYDLEGRLATKQELLRTYQSYLGRANNIEEILAVEARISELQYDIDGTGIQLRNLANRVDYATIDLTLLGPVSSTPSQGLTFGERAERLFKGFGGFLSTAGFVLLSIVVYGTPILLIVSLLFWLLLGKVGLLKKLWKIIRK
ncbi:MAG: DUF4349 domain-containing protein [Treponema sp.]|nr:DUF4349 domain-containing protein [Treponema sp.]